MSPTSFLLFPRPSNSPRCVAYATPYANRWGSLGHAHYGWEVAIVNGDEALNVGKGHTTVRATPSDAAAADGESATLLQDGDSSAVHFGESPGSPVKKNGSTRVVKAGDVQKTKSGNVLVNTFNTTKEVITGLLTENFAKTGLMPVIPARDLYQPTEAEQGELCFRGRTIMMGYLANSDLGEEHVAEITQKTSEAIDDHGFMHSGDKGCWDEFGKTNTASCIQAIKGVVSSSVSDRSTRLHA